jgi:hypothetical protein
MKNLCDLSVKMSDEANIVGPETDNLKIYGGVNFIALDIDDAATLVSFDIYTNVNVYVCIFKKYRHYILYVGKCM